MLAKEVPGLPSGCNKLRHVRDSASGEWYQIKIWIYNQLNLAFRHIMLQFLRICIRKHNKLIIVINSEHDIYFRKVLANVTFRVSKWQLSIFCICNSSHNLLTCYNWRTLFNMIRNNVDLLLEIPLSSKTGQIPLQIGCDLRSVSATTFNQIWLTSIWNRLAAYVLMQNQHLFYIMIWWQVLIQAIDYSVHTHMIGN